MGVFERLFKPKNKELDVLRLSLRDSFSRVQTDVHQMKSWIVHLHQIQTQLSEHHHAHRGLTQQELTLLAEKISKLEQDQQRFSAYLSQLIDYLQKKSENESKFVSELNKFKYELELVKSRREMEFEKGGSLSSVRTEHELLSAPVSNISSRQEKSNSKQQKPSTGFEEQLLQKFRQHRKEYVLQKILDLIQGEELTVNELEEIVVERKQLCGRTAFFSYLKELRFQGFLEDVLAGKRKILVSKSRIVRKNER